jgi:hypothetical protein
MAATKEQEQRGWEARADGLARRINHFEARIEAALAALREISDLRYAELKGSLNPTIVGPGTIRPSAATFPPPYIELQEHIQMWDCIHTWTRPVGLPDDLFDWFKGRVIPFLIEAFTDGGPHHTVTALKGLHFVEMTWPTIRYGHFTEYDWAHTVVEVGRHEYIHTVTPKQSSAALFMISEDIDEQESYEWEELPVHALQWFADKVGIEISDLSDPEGKVCSSYNAEIMSVLKNPWTWNGLNDPLPSPQDIRRADQYRLIGSWNTKQWVWEE